MRNWQKQFFVIWTGQGLSHLTSSIVQMAIIWYITARTESAAVLSFATMAGFLPQAVLGLFVGAVIDRHDRKRIMILSDLVMSGVCVALAFVGMAGEIPIGLIFAALMIRSIGNAFYAPSLQAITPSIVPREYLTKYAGYAQTVDSVAMIASPALAAVLYGILPLWSILMMDVAGAFFCVGALVLAKIPENAGKKETQGREPLLKEVKEGYEAVRKTSGMMALVLIGALYAVIYFPIGTLYPLITISYFQGGVQGSGMVETVFSLGMLVGSLALGIWGDRIDHRKTIAASIGTYGLGTMVTGLLPPEGFPVFVCLTFFMGISSPLYFGVQTAIYQMKIQKEYLGRALSLSNSSRLVAMPLGLMLSGAFAGAVGIEKWFSLLGAASVGLAAWTLWLPAFRKLREKED